jgi:hypothetical protein
VKYKQQQREEKKLNTKPICQITAMFARPLTIIIYTSCGKLIRRDTKVLPESTEAARAVLRDVAR